MLSPVESVRKSLARDSRSSRSQAVRRFAEENFSGGIYGQPKEQVLQVHCRSISWNGLDQVIDMNLEGLEIRNLSPCEIWSQHLARMLPLTAIRRKNAYTQSEEAKGGDSR